MDNILIRIEELPQWLAEKHFKNQDLVSVEDLIAKLEDLSDDYESLQEEFENYKEYVESNYKEMSVKEQVE